MKNAKTHEMTSLYGTFVLHVRDSSRDINAIDRTEYVNRIILEYQLTEYQIVYNTNGMLESRMLEVVYSRVVCSGVVYLGVHEGGGN